MDELYARLAANGTTSWYLTDRLGSVRQIVDPMGNVLDQLTYGAFGNILSETNASNGDRFKFGGEYDSNLGLYRFGERWYSPTDGRFISQDPLSFAAEDANLYRYVTNMPTELVDPLGLQETTTSRERNPYRGLILGGEPYPGTYALQSPMAAYLRIAAIGSQPYPGTYAQQPVRTALVPPGRFYYSHYFQGLNMGIIGSPLPNERVLNQTGRNLSPINPLGQLYWDYTSRAIDMRMQGVQQISPFQMNLIQGRMGLPNIPFKGYGGMSSSVDIDVGGNRRIDINPQDQYQKTGEMMKRLPPPVIAPRPHPRPGQQLPEE